MLICVQYIQFHVGLSAIWIWRYMYYHVNSLIWGNRSLEKWKHTQIGYITGGRKWGKVGKCAPYANPHHRSRSPTRRNLKYMFRLLLKRAEKNVLGQCLVISKIWGGTIEPLPQPRFGNLPWGCVTHLQ